MGASCSTTLEPWGRCPIIVLLGVHFHPISFSLCYLFPVSLYQTRSSFPRPFSQRYSVTGTRRRRTRPSSRWRTGSSTTCTRRLPQGRQQPVSRPSPSVGPSPRSGRPQARPAPAAAARHPTDGDHWRGAPERRWETAAAEPSKARDQSRVRRPCRPLPADATGGRSLSECARARVWY